MVPSHYLNQWWFIASWILWNKLEWNWVKIWRFSFIQENSFQSVVCKMAAILFQDQCVNILSLRQNGWQFANNIFNAFQMQILGWISMKFEHNFTKPCSWGGGGVKYASIGSDDGLAPIRWQAIIWNNDGLIYWCIHASLSVKELKLCGCIGTGWSQRMCRRPLRQK